MLSIYLAIALTVASTFLLACGPQTWVAVILTFIPQAFGTIPFVVIAPAIMMRVCRTYGLDPKAYAETIMAVITAGMACVFSLMSLVGGIAVDHMGFRTWFLIIAIVICTSPIAVFWGFNEKVMGKPLAPMADESTEAEEHAKRLEKAAAVSKDQER